MTPQELKKEFKERFGDSAFTWNGENATGRLFARRQRRNIADWWLEKFHQHTKEMVVELLEKVTGLKREFWDDQDHAVGGYISKKDVVEAIKSFNKE